MHKATKTLEAINTALMSDQGAKYRGLLRHTMPLAEDAYSEEEGGFRSHLGASLIGRKCARELWYSFHWTTAKKFDGRILQLFNRGHLEEARFVALLQMIGCTVYQHDEHGKQFRIIGHKGHFGGSLDAVIVGCPDVVEGVPILGEFKTHNDKSFQKLKSDGVMASKWEHFIQMMIYCGKNGLPAALYLAVNKNDDEIHGEIVQFDPTQYQKYLDRSAAIIDAPTPPPRINESPGWWECSFCDHKPVCHGAELPERNCRTCWYSRPLDNAEWVCTHPIPDAAFGDNVPLSKEDQLKGCELYKAHPDIKKK